MLNNEIIRKKLFSLKFMSLSNTKIKLALSQCFRTKNESPCVGSNKLFIDLVSKKNVYTV